MASGGIRRLGVGLAFAASLMIGAVAQAAGAVTADGPMAGDRTEGRAEAPVTVTAYLSPTCPHCAEWWLGDWPAFKAAYVDPGRVRMVWRELPTQPQQLSGAAILIARCAPEARYGEAIGAFMAGQAALYQTGQPAPWLQAGGRAAGLDSAAVEACLSNPANVEALNTRLALAQADGVTGTPSMLVDGERIADPSLAGLRAAVDARLVAPRAP